MELNLQNYEENYEKAVISRLNKKMKNTKALVLISSVKELLATKIYATLKREYSISLIQMTESLPAFQKIDFSDLNQLQAYLILNEIDTIIFTSELIDAFVECFGLENTYAYIHKVRCLTKNLNIKIVYVYAKYILYGWKKIEHIKDCLADDKMLGNYLMVMEEILSQPQNLVFGISTFYGRNEFSETQDFTSYVLQLWKQKKNEDFDDEIKVNPLLADEIAQTVCDYVDQQGKYVIGDMEQGITLHEWTQQIVSLLDGEQESHTLSQHDYQKINIENDDTAGAIIERSFLNVQSGYLTMNKQKKCLFQLIYKMSPLEYFYGYRVAEMRTTLGAAMAKTLSADVVDNIDCVVPVPNTGLYYAMGLARAINKPLMIAMTKNSEKIRSFQLVDNNVRKQVIQNKVLILDELLEGKNVIIVDEAIFTGTTLKVVCQRLRQTGLKQLHIAIPTPQCPSQCEYYVQPRRSMLLEYMRLEMLPDYFNADTVTFQSMQEFIHIIEQIDKGFCFSCFGGED